MQREESLTECDPGHLDICAKGGSGRQLLADIANACAMSFWPRVEHVRRSGPDLALSLPAHFSGVVRRRGVNEIGAGHQIHGAPEPPPDIFMSADASNRRARARPSSNLPRTGPTPTFTRGLEVRRIAP
jgi:hypothetical protein